MNITDPIWSHAKSSPERPAIYCDGRVLGFATFCGHVDSAARNLAKAGIVPGQRVAVASGNLLMHLVAVLALARLGATSVAAAYGMPAEAQSELARKCGVTAFLRSHEAWTIAGIPASRHLLTDRLVDGTPASDGAQASAAVGDQPWRVWLSSGTTGAPKGIAWTHRSYAAYLRRLQATWPSGPSERVLLFMDPGLLFGMNYSLSQLCAGGALVVPLTIESAEVLKCLRRDRVTQLITSTANAWSLLQHLRTHDPSEAEATQRLRCFLLAGSAVSAPLQEELRGRVCANLYINYGSTEAGTISRADPDALERFPGTSGYLMPWVEAQTLDDEGMVLPKGAHGHLRFRVPVSANGYEGDPEATARVFRDGWYYPGDTGSVDARGLLRLGARADDLINIAGLKVDPLAIEAVLNEDPAVRESVVVVAATDEGAPVLVAAVVAHQPIDAKALQAKCRERLGPERSPAAIAVVARLPRSDQGKILRREVARMVRIQAGSAGHPGDEKGS